MEQFLQHLLFIILSAIVPIVIYLFKLLLTKLFVECDEYDAISDLPVQFYSKINKINTLPHDLLWLAFSICLISAICVEKYGIDTSSSFVKTPLTGHVIVSFGVSVVIFFLLTLKYKIGSYHEIEGKNEMLAAYRREVVINNVEKNVYIFDEGNVSQPNMIKLGTIYNSIWYICLFLVLALLAVNSVYVSWYLNISL